MSHARLDMSDAGIELRPATAADQPLLLSIYAGTREQEMANSGWSVPEQQRFLAMQFEARDRHYRAHYPDADYLLIWRRGAPVGRLTLSYTARELRIMDVALLPAFRGQGIGGAILADLQEQARRRRQSLSIHVERDNPARALYARLGFAPVEERGLYLLMQWDPAAHDAGAAAAQQGVER